jgi:dihydrolipoamide dehydrogenase
VVGRGLVQAGDRTLSCRGIILATGGEWSSREFDGSGLDDVVNGDDLLNARTLPGRIILHGRSPWIVEIAQFFRRFGSEVILSTPDETLLPNESKTITTRLKRMLTGQGVSIKTSVRIARARKEPDGLHVELEREEGIETVVADRLAILDRKAAMGDLGLRSLGLSEEGEFLKVNERMETAVAGVYGIGDLTGPLSMHYSGLASAGALVAAENAMGVHAAINPKTFTRVLFTQPQIACVGLTKREAKHLGYDVVVGSAPYSMNSLGMLLSEEDGIVEVVAERKYGELLGAHFFGSAATEMAGQAVMAIDLEITLEQLGRTSFPHPTLSESFSEAARDALQRPIYLP